MIERLTLSIDAMGGDNAPRMIVEGVELEAGEVSPAHLIEFWGLLPVEREPASIDRKILDLSRG